MSSQSTTTTTAAGERGTPSLRQFPCDLHVGPKQQQEQLSRLEVPGVPPLDCASELVVLTCPACGDALGKFTLVHMHAGETYGSCLTKPQLKANSKFKNDKCKPHLLAHANDGAHRQFLQPRDGRVRRFEGVVVAADVAPAPAAVGDQAAHSEEPSPATVDHAMGEQAMDDVSIADATMDTGVIDTDGATSPSATAATAATSSAVLKRAAPAAPTTSSADTKRNVQRAGTGLAAAASAATTQANVHGMIITHHKRLQVDAASPLSLPCVVETRFAHPKYGPMRVVAVLWWVDEQNKDGLSRRPNNYERYRAHAQHGLADRRVCYFHRIYAVEPQHVPGAVFVDQWFSSLNASAVAFGNCDPGWTAWYVYGHPKLTLHHVTSTVGFRNSLYLEQPPRLVDAEKVAAGVMSEARAKELYDLNLHAEIKPLLPPRRIVRVWSIPFRDYFGAMCLLECNEHQCSGGENPTERYTCPHGLEHAPFEANEDPNDQPMFYVPKQVAVVRPDEEEDDDPTTTGPYSSAPSAASSSKRTTSEGDGGTRGSANSNSKARKKKAAKAQRKYRDHVPTVWDARIIFDRLAAVQRSVAYRAHTVVHELLRELMRSDPALAVLNNAIPLRFINTDECLKRMFEYFDVECQYIPDSTNPTVWGFIEFGLKARAIVSSQFVRQRAVEYTVNRGVMRSWRREQRKLRQQQQQQQQLQAAPRL